MRILFASTLVLCLAGCAGGGRVSRPPVAPPQEADASGAPRGPGESGEPCIDCDPSGDPTVAESAPARVSAAECREAAGLAVAGDHKLAVDTLRALVSAGGSCDAQVVTAIDESRRVLAAADALVRQGLDAQRAGDVATAGDRFRRALAVYPKYYWVQRLERELAAERPAAVAELRQQSGELRAAGRLEEALELLEQAKEKAPLDTELGTEIEGLRTELGDLRLAAAHRLQQAGKLWEATELTREAVAARPGDPVRGRVIDFARRLGLNLFSSGELIESQAVWQAALELDEDNELLRGYLAEVEMRLRSLDDIKRDDDQPRRRR